MEVAVVERVVRDVVKVVLCWNAVCVNQQDYEPLYRKSNFVGGEKVG
jgi:hypothetical protein